jgi:uncharacterized protein (TIGR02266 family)
MVLQSNPSPNRPEKRQTPRVAAKIEVSLHTENNFYAGITENLSEGGLFIATYENLPVGTELELTVAIPNHPPIKTTGTVRWIREHNQFTSDVSPGVGVQFQQLGDSDRRAIEAFLRTRAPMLYEV